MITSSAADQGRYQAALSDFDDVNRRLQNRLTRESATLKVSCPLKELPGGDCYCVRDFISALIDVNRSSFNLQNDEETRRKYLFGVDQIITG